MATLLYLVHRMPYPPDKGDKVRSYHVLKHLLRSHRVFVGTFIDDPDDERHLPVLEQMCAGSHVARLQPGRARLASLRGLVSGEALTLPYYRDAGLARWVAQVVDKERPDACIVFSSSMAQYATTHPQVPMLVDFVDVDSAKWAAYAPRHRWPLSWVYAREGRRLLAYERAVALQAQASFFAADQEADLFRQLAPECANGVQGMANGVDAEYFVSAADRPSPFAADELPLVFTGAMDYWPNVDAVAWFVREALPALRQRHARVRLHIVGRNPTAEVRGLAGEAVTVTGTVPDVRPYLQHAAVVVAPLRLARGIQNKVLEAMAMARPVVAAAPCAAAIQAQDGRHLLSANEAADYVRAVDTVLGNPARAADLGAAARALVLADYDWQARLQKLDRCLATVNAVNTLGGVAA